MVGDRLKSFFAPLVRRSFLELGLYEQTVVDYVTDLLAAFARSDRLHRLRSVEGRSIDSVVEILSERMSPSSKRHRLEWERDVRQYVGDYTLFMSGVFRSHVAGGGYLDFYLQEGSRSYRSVSKIDLALYRTGFLLFEELAKNFEFYSGALDYLRKAYFAPSVGEDPFGGFLREIEGWVKLGISNN
jgi:hypothetical protein